MHHHSTKQRLAALRRRFGIQLTPPKPRERGPKLGVEATAALKAAHDEAAAALEAAREVSRRIVASLTPAPIYATASGPGTGSDSPTTVAQAPYPSQHLSATDAERARSGVGEDAGGGATDGSRRWRVAVILVAIALGLAAWYGLSRRSSPIASPPTPAPATAQALAPTPPPPPPPPPPAPSPRAPRSLTVAEGDCLWRLSATHLGDALAWRRVFEANRGTIRNPDLIYPGQVIELP